MAWIIVIAVVAVLAIGLIVLYNSLVRARNKVDNSWKQIDIQLKRRYDLIPNLVEMVKDYMSYEQEVLENVTKARAAAMSAQGPREQGQAENFLSETLKSLFAVAENYPDLKANQNFLELQRELTDTEDKIAYSRQFYNTNVSSYNQKIQVFPAVMIAGMFGFTQEEFFEAEEEARGDVEVSFSTT